jgi:hypothetical protein
MFGMWLSFLFFQGFYPRPVYDDNSEVDEEVLKKVIDDVLVSDAITVYQLLQKKGQSKSYQGIMMLDPNRKDVMAGHYRLQMADCCGTRKLHSTYIFGLFS